MKGKLKKVLTALVALAMGTVFALSGCQPAEGTHGGDLGLKDYGLDEKYVPVAPDVQHSGKVDVHLVFGETLAAWENVVTEYSKLQSVADVTWAVFLQNDCLFAKRFIEFFCTQYGE